MPNSVNGELYLTDAVEILHSVNKRVEAVPADDFREALGANTPDELSLLATMGV